MNPDYLSMFIVAYVLHNRRELQEIDVELLTHQGLKNILTKAKSLTIKSDEITRGLLVSVISPTDIATMERVYNLWEKDLSKRDIETIKSELHEIKLQLKEHHKKKAFVDYLRHLADLAEQGELHKVNRELNVLHYSNTTEVDLTVNYMVDSIRDTNGFKTGIYDIDTSMGGLHKGNIMGIFGDTGSMKTMASFWMMIKILETNPTFIAVYFEKEMPIKDLARRLVSYCMGVDTHAIMQLETDEDKSIFGDQILEFFHENKSKHDLMKRFHLVPRNMFSTSADMVEYVKYYKADIWCLDFMTMLFESNEGLNENTFIIKEMGILKDLVDRTNTLGIILGQLKQDTVETRNNKIPKMSDMEWGKQLKQYAAYMFATFYPSNYYDRAVPDEFFYLIGTKTRNGKKMTIPLEAKPGLCRFEEAEFNTRKPMLDWLSSYKSNNGIKQ